MSKLRRAVCAALATVLALTVLCGTAFGASAAVSVSTGSGGTLSVTVSENGGTLWQSGTVSGSASNNITFTTNYSVTVTASPAAGYAVNSIVIGGTSYTGSNTQTVSGLTADALQISATFGSTSYTLTTAAYTDETQSTTGGTVTAGGGYAAGTAISLTAKANEGYKFTGWSTDAGTLSSGTDTTTTFTMPGSNCTVKASFKKLTKHKLTVTSDGKGSTCISDGSNAITSTASGEYYEGDTIRLVSKADSGYTLNYWYTKSGGTIVSRYWYATDFVMPDGDVTVSAEFVKSATEETTKPGTTTPGADPGAETTDPVPSGDSYIITIEKTDGGSVTASETSAAAGAAITLQATPNAGYSFSGWVSTAGGSFTDPKAAFTTFTVPAADTTIVATFTKTDSSAVTPGTSDTTDPGSSSKGGFPWLWVGIGAAAVALIVGVIAVLLERRNRVSYSDPEDDQSEEVYEQPEQKRPQRKKLFGRRDKFDPPEKDDPTYDDSFFDDF